MFDLGRTMAMIGSALEMKSSVKSADFTTSDHKSVRLRLDDGSEWIVTARKVKTG